MRTEILALLNDSAPLVAATPGGRWGRPLRRLRPGLLPSHDPMATPEAFTATDPPLLVPSVVVSPQVLRQDHGGEMPQGWAAQYVVTLAYYAPPGGEGTLESMAALGARAITGHRVPVPQGGSGRIRATNLTVGPDAAPEFPNSGIVLLDTFLIASVWRIPA